MDKEKLVAALKANGIDEETIASILDDLGEKPSDESDPADGNPEKEVPPTNPEEVVPQEVPPSGNPEEVPAEEETPKPEEVPPLPPDEQAVPPSEVPPSDVPPAPNPEEQPAPQPEVPPVPPFDPTELLAKLDEQGKTIAEQQKTIDTLLSRIDALTEGLTQAGVLETSPSEEDVGLENRGIPGSGSKGVDSAMSSVLTKLNANRL